MSGANLTRTDPVLRTFRAPLHVRLRERIDTLTDEVRELRKELRKQDETNRSLTYQLKRAEKKAMEYASLCAKATLIDDVKGGELPGSITPEPLT